MLESKIETRLKHDIENIGGLALKFISPGINGMPDRIVLLPGGRLIFVELKAPGGRPRKLQFQKHKELKKLGFDVRVIDSLELVQKFVKELEGWKVASI